jgi:hypothetical protein
MSRVNPLARNHDFQKLKNSPRQQKMAVVFLAFLSIGIIVVWVLQLNTQLRKPYGTDKPLAVSPVATSTDLHLLDTDGDGLSDYDEINIYHTSPYLEDTDGDGINDKQEIIQGTDPNCATGADCSNKEDLFVATSSSITDSIIGSTTDITGSTTDTAGTEAAILDPAEVTPAMLRQILLQNGYDQATLDQISDADIMRSYQEATQAQSPTSPASATSSPSSASSTSQ